MLVNYAVFDFGESFYRDRTVLELIWEKLPVSASLGVWSTPGLPCLHSAGHQQGGTPWLVWISGPPR